MLLTVLSTELPVVLVHDWLDGTIPWGIRLIPFLYNRWYRRACSRVIAGRRADLTREAWITAAVPVRLVETVSAIIASEYYWPYRMLFHPEDECFVLFCFWRRTWVDSLELPCCIMRVEQQLGVEVPDDIVPRLGKMLFGDFLRELVQLAQASPTSKL
ncbi:MAG: hypothetical protein KatS3mg112_0615 [Thermogutta sp.]|nr:MAG: hypothetical protein KatS3mg112_0615 [Thermogutta sp.]